MSATRPYRPSNGTEGMDFMAQFCERCSRDAAHQADPEFGTGCPIVAATLVLNEDDPAYPPEWIEDDVEGWDTNPRCTAFDPMPDDGVGPIDDARQEPLL